MVQGAARLRGSTDRAPSLPRLDGRSIAIGGGRGFVGRNVAEALADAGATVLPFGREGAPSGSCDALVWAGGGRGSDPERLRADHETAATAAIAALRPAIVVYLSSAEVYGQAPVPFREDGPLSAVTPYGRAKRAAEVAVTETAAAISAAVFILRPGVVYGVDQPPVMLLPAAARALAAGEPFPATMGRQTRDFLAVADLAELVLRCLAPGAPPGTYNAGFGAEVTVRDALRILARAVGEGAEPLLRLGAIPQRNGEADRYALDTEKVRGALGWTPRTRLDVGLTALAHAALERVVAARP